MARSELILNGNGGKMKTMVIIVRQILNDFGQKVTKI